MVNETTEVSTEITEVCQESGDRTIQQGFRAEVTEQYGDWMVARRTSHKFGKRGDSKEVNQAQNQKLTSRNNGNMTNSICQILRRRPRETVWEWDLVQRLTGFKNLGTMTDMRMES
jgi:hypothetical protein